MNETLQIEHLCGYLPYGLKLYQRGYGNDLFTKMTGSNMMNLIDGSTSYKPLVIPLSELTRELVNNEMPEQLIRICKTNQKHILTYGYQTICILMKYHVDVFGLLEKGLAVNKLTF